MAGQIISTFKDNRIQEYMNNGNYNRAREIAERDKYEPITKAAHFHPEEEAKVEDVNDFLTDVLNDVSIIDQELYLIAAEYQELVRSIDGRVNNALKLYKSSQEKIKDLNMICGEESSFYSIKYITDEDLLDDVVFEDGVLGAGYTEDKRAEIEVIDIQGNGMEGNYFVYKNGAMLADTIATDNRETIVDEEADTYYEYQRLRTSNRDNVYFTGVNLDNADVSCTITLKASSTISGLKIASSDNHIIMKHVAISSDGISFTTAVEKDVAINEIDNNYETEMNYIFGSGIISFPMTQYVRITFSTEHVTSDAIAFIYEETKWSE